MADGTVYNVGMSITLLGPRYNVVCFRPNCVIAGKMFSQFDGGFLRKKNSRDSPITAYQGKLIKKMKESHFLN